MGLAGWLVAFIVFGAGAYLLLIRPWHLNWGATPEEARRSLPGDDLLRGAFLSSTRAVTVNSAAVQIWPWIVQMGYRQCRLLLIDNDRIPSANEIIPELQHLEIGGIMPTGPTGGFKVAAMDAPRSIVLVVDEKRFKVISVIVLDEIVPGRTRHICRLRVDFRRDLRGLLYYALFEPGDFVMMRKMMLGIKERAERGDAAPL